MSQHRTSGQQSFLAQTTLMVIAGWASFSYWPVMVGDQVRWFPMLALILSAMAALSVSAQCLFWVARTLDWIAAHQPKPSPNAARWARWADLKSVLATKSQQREGRSLFFGVMQSNQKKPLIIPVHSAVYCLAPSRSGKGISFVVPNICHLAGAASKVIVDLKGELAAMTKDLLEREGEKVYRLNPSGKFKDKVGETDQLNPLDMIINDFYTPGFLDYVFDDLHELSGILIQEKDDSKTDPFWPLGAREVIEMATLIEVVIEGREATLPQVARLIIDRRQLEMNLRWIVGVNLDGTSEPPMPINQSDWAQYHSEHSLSELTQVIRGLASDMLAFMSGHDSKQFNSFLKQAHQAVKPFAFGKLAKVMGKSSFDIRKMKDPKSKSSLFIMLDETRMETNRRYLELVQWQVFTTLKRHENKDIPVYFFLDEITNYFVKGLDRELTVCAGYGLYLIMIFQALAAFEKTYGKEALETLQSEAEIKLFLAGQRSPQTLEFISSKLLGEEHIVKTSLSKSTELESGLGESFSQEKRQLKTMNSIREGNTGLLIVRDEKPIETISRSYAEINPWRNWVDINPFHNKPFKKKARLRIKIFK